MEKRDKLPTIIVTGASGTVGKSFLEAAKDEFLIYALARRSQKEAGVPVHPNIKWIQVDIANWISLRWVMHNIKHSGGADYVLHLAAYYDFSNEPHPEYERTNVQGTRSILEQCKILRVKRFIFASSVAACNFPPLGSTINEKTPVDADFPYAVTKRKGEEMVREFSKWIPSSIVRFAAVFTDWCEYGVLYMFLSTWLSKKLESRILGGKGESAVPYIHARDLCKLLLTIFKNSDRLPQLETYIASPDGSTSHRELYEIATRFYYGRKKNPIFIPRFIAYPGAIVKDWLGRLIGNRPFLRPWMIEYVDFKLDIDASYTRSALSWEPTPRNYILRRILFLVEKMKSDPLEWHSKNTTALKKISLRPNLLIYEIMVRIKDDLLGEIGDALLTPQNCCQFPNFQQDKDNLNWFLNIIYQLLSSAIRNHDRMLLVDYIKELSFNRFNQGFGCNEICAFLSCMGEIIQAKLYREPELKGLNQDIHDHVSMTLQLAMDEVEDAYEQFIKQEFISQKVEVEEIERKISRLDTFYKSPEPEAEEEITEAEEHLLQ